MELLWKSEILMGSTNWKKLYFLHYIYFKSRLISLSEQNYDELFREFDFNLSAFVTLRKHSI